MNPRPLLTRFSPIFTKGVQSAVLAASLSLLFIAPANAADFSGSLKGVTITDAASSNNPPVAAFTYTVNGNTVNLDASSSTDPDGAISEYKWDFGDGSVGSGVKTEHTYSTADSRIVKISLKDNNNGVSIYQQSILLKSCSSTPTYSNTSTPYNTEWRQQVRYIGLKYTGSSNFNICSLKFNATEVINFSNQKIYAQVYQLSGTSLGTKLGQKEIVASSVAAGWNTVTFDTPIATGTNGFAIVFSIPSTTGEYFKLGYTGRINNYTTVAWNPDLTQDFDFSGAPSMEIYE